MATIIGAGSPCLSVGSSCKGACASSPDAQFASPSSQDRLARQAVHRASRLAADPS